MTRTPRRMDPAAGGMLVVRHPLPASAAGAQGQGRAVGRRPARPHPARLSLTGLASFPSSIPDRDDRRPPVRRLRLPAGAGLGRTPPHDRRPRTSSRHPPAARPQLVGDARHAQEAQAGRHRRLCHVRHPMYSAFWLLALAQAALLANRVAGSPGIVGWGVLFFLRVGREERLMIDTFGEIPGVHGPGPSAWFRGSIDQRGCAGPVSQRCRGRTDGALGHADDLVHVGSPFALRGFVADRSASSDAARSAEGGDQPGTAAAEGVPSRWRRCRRPPKPPAEAKAWRVGPRPRQLHPWPGDRAPRPGQRLFARHGQAGQGSQGLGAPVSLSNHSTWQTISPS